MLHTVECNAILLSRKFQAAALLDNAASRTAATKSGRGFRAQRAAPLEAQDPATLGLRFWRVDHSIPGSAAWGIDTPIGWVIYSGDLRMHGHSRQRTEKFVKEAAA